MLSFVCATVAACSESATEMATAPDAVSGIYVLESAAGKSLPATLTDQSGYRLEIVAGAYSLFPDGTYTSFLTIRESIETTASPNVTTYDERAIGVYLVTAQIVRFTDSGGSEAVGEIAAKTLSFHGAIPRTYRK